MTTTKEFHNLAMEVMNLEAMLATAIMLTVGREVAQELGEPLDDRQRRQLTREALGWAAEAITRIEAAHRIANAAGEN